MHDFESLRIPYLQVRADPRQPLHCGRLGGRAQDALHSQAADEGDAHRGTRSAPPPVGGPRERSKHCDQRPTPSHVSRRLLCRALLLARRSRVSLSCPLMCLPLYPYPWPGATGGDPQVCRPEARRARPPRWRGDEEARRQGHSTADGGGYRADHVRGPSRGGAMAREGALPGPNALCVACGCRSYHTHTDGHTHTLGHSLAAPCHHAFPCHQPRGHAVVPPPRRRVACRPRRVSAHAKARWRLIRHDGDRQGL